jgi:hypothetical protein
MNRLLPLLAVVTIVFGGGCTLLFAADARLCDVDSDCAEGEECNGGFCRTQPPPLEDPSTAEGEGDVGEGEGEGDVGEGEGEGDVGEGEGEGDVGEGEGEGDVGEGEGEGDVFTGCGDVPATPWADAAFPFRLPLSLCDVQAPVGTLPSLAVLVRLSGTDLDFDAIRADGHDVRFIDQRGATPVVLGHERPLFTNAAGTTSDEAIFWVNVPNVNLSTERDHIWLYYGSVDATDTSSGAAAFADYNAAWHFDDVAGTIALPESKTGTSSKVAASNLATAPSFVDRGLALSGTDSFVVLDDQPPAPADPARRPPFALQTAEGSFSLLLGPFDDNGTARPLGNGQAVFYSDGQAPPSPGFDNRSIHLTLVDTTGSDRAGLRVSLPTNPAPTTLEGIAVASAALDRTVFSHVLVSWTATGVQVYVNGAAVANGVANIIPFAVDVIELGSSQLTGNLLRAGLDELRVSNQPRTAAFAYAEARNIGDRIVTPGVVQPRP